jgi:crotonobetainyl-CoA:carnitine CoA-transferase CaiB-like acyl-CoA transferase
MTPPAESILSGLRVIDCGTFILGPMATTIMSDFGADVVKIEAPGIGDPHRYLHRIVPMPASDIDYCWQLASRNKRSVVVDLKQDKGRELLLKLIEKADVFVTNFPTSVLDQLRINYDDVNDLNPRLVYARATGYGERGPDVEQPGYDMTAWWARSGLMDVIRSKDSEPALSVGGMGDHPSSVAMFSAIMLALYQRQTTGRGAKASTSLMANGIWSNACFVQAALVGAQRYTYPSRGAAPNALVNHYVTRDGKRFILCGIRADRDWIGVCRSIGREDLLRDPRFDTAEKRYALSAEVVPIFDAAFVAKDLAEWRAIFKQHDVTVSPVMQYFDVADDPAVQANDVIVEFDHPTHGAVRTVNSPMFVDGSPKVPPRPAPAHGQHSAEVARELGYSDAQIAELQAAGVLHAPK